MSKKCNLLEYIYQMHVALRDIKILLLIDLKMHHFSVQLKTFLIGHSIKILSLKVLITKTNLEWFANYPQHPDDGNISGASMKRKHIPHRMN